MSNNAAGKDRIPIEQVRHMVDRLKARRAHLEQDHATLKGHSVYLDEAHKQYTDALDLFIKELAGKVRISEQAGAPFVLYPLVMFDQACFRTFF